jgi:hypothetical protein
VRTIFLVEDEMNTICYEPCKGPTLSVTWRQVIVLIVATLLVLLGARLAPSGHAGDGAQINGDSPHYASVGGNDQ